MLPSVLRALFLSFFKADSCPPIEAFRKSKEHKDLGWRVTSCNFRLTVKSNFSPWVVCVLFLSNAS